MGRSNSKISGEFKCMCNDEINLYLLKLIYSPYIYSPYLYIEQFLFVMYYSSYSKHCEYGSKQNI